MSKILVAYFSATGRTKKRALRIAEELNADIHEIKPAVPYEKKDLNWMDRTSRSTLEMKDLDCRPEIASDDFDVTGYDIIYLGFPIWWYEAPRIISTFLEKYDFSGKKIVIFATSGGSGFGSTVQHLKTSVSDNCIITEGTVNGK